MKRGKGISVSVENITPFGIWLYVKEKEYFLNYRDFPYFRNQILASILNVQLLHGYHLYWPDLDVDLEIGRDVPRKPRLLGGVEGHTVKGNYLTGKPRHVAGELHNLENPEKYRLRTRIVEASSSHPRKRSVSSR